MAVALCCKQGRHYCETCSVNICSRCLSIGEHHGHTLIGNRADSFDWEQEAEHAYYPTFKDFRTTLAPDVGKLEYYYSELEAAEKSCQRWLQCKVKASERLRRKEVPCDYNECITGLQQSKQRVASLNYELQARFPAFVPLMESQCLEEFEIRENMSRKSDPEDTLESDQPESLYESMDNGFSPDGSVTYQQQRHMNTSTEVYQRKIMHMTAFVSQSDIDLEPAPIYQPEMVIDGKNVGQPTRVSINCDIVVVTEGSTIRYFKSGKLVKIITRVGMMGLINLTRPEGVTYYAQKKKFLILDANSKKQYLIKVNLETEKYKPVSLKQQVTNPNEVTINPGSNPIVFVTDPQAMCIFKYKTNGEYRGAFDLRRVGVQRPAGIAYADGYLLLADTDQHCIFKLDPEGICVNKIGRLGNQPGFLNQPYGIAALPDGLFAVTEMGNHRVSVFSTEGKFHICFGRQGKFQGMFMSPKGISADSTNLAVVDYGNQRLQLFKLHRIPMIYERLA